jgi:hypothetical protein
VKCDETKPSCIKCTSTGRKCDGYVMVQPKAKSAAAKSKSKQYELMEPSRLAALSRRPFGINGRIFPNICSTGSDQERRGLSYFRTRTISVLSGYFESDFWNSLVFNASEFDIVIRHAVVSISSLHECFEMNGPLRTVQGTAHQQFALQQYDKAVTGMVQKLSSRDEGGTSTTVIACVLFVFAELMQDNHLTAMSHLKNGIQILNDYRGGDFSFRSTKRVKSKTSFAVEQLSQIFVRVLIQSIFLGAPYYIAPVMPVVDDINDLSSFGSVEEAQWALDCQFISIYPLLLECSKPGLGVELSHLEVQQLYHAKNLQRWHNTFIAFIRQYRPSFTPKVTTGTTLLQIHYLALKTVLGTALDASDISYARHTSSFVRIISLSESVLSSALLPASSSMSSNSTSSPKSDSSTGSTDKINSITTLPPIPDSNLSTLPAFTFDLGLTAPLFHTAVRCRHSPTRHRALALLRLVPHREGIWESAMALSMASHIVKIEEEENMIQRASLGEPCYYETRGNLNFAFEFDGRADDEGKGEGEYAKSELGLEEDTQTKDFMKQMGPCFQEPACSPIPCMHKLFSSSTVQTQAMGMVERTDTRIAHQQQGRDDQAPGSRFYSDHEPISGAGFRLEPGTVTMGQLGQKMGRLGRVDMRFGHQDSNKAIFQPGFVGRRRVT